MSPDDDLTGIFMLIESSEQIVEVKKKVLSDVIQQNEEYLSTLLAIRECNKDRKGKLEELESEFIHVEQKFSDLERQCRMTIQQKVFLCETIELSQNKLYAAEKVISDIRKEFKDTSNTFLMKYDITSKWLVKRKMEASKLLAIILSDIKEINREIKHLEDKNCERVEMEDKLGEMRKIYRNKIETTKEMARLKDCLADFPNNDAHCKRLYDELKENKEQCLKDQYHNLSKELKYLEDQYVIFSTSMTRFGC